MIKKILLTFLFAFVCFLGIDNVYALNSFNGNANISGLYMTFSGSQLGINGTYSLAGIGQAPIRYEGHIEYPYDLDLSYAPSSLYSRTAFCYTGSSMSIVSNSGVSLLQKTSIPCQQNLNNSTGHIYFVQRNFTPDVEDHNVYSLSDNYALRFSSDAEYISFYGLNYSYEPFPNYNETDILLKSNDDISKDLDAIISNQNQIIYKLNESINELTDMKSLLSNILYYIKNIYDLFKCEEVNLLNPNGSSSTSSGITFTNNNDGTFTISGTASTSKSFSLTTSPPVLKKNTSYTLSLVVLENTGSNFNIPISILDENGDIVYNFFTVKPGSTTSTKTVSRNTTINSISVYIPKDYTVNATFQVQFEEGSSASPYLPYGQCRSMIDTIKDSSVQNSQNSEAIKNSINDDDTSESSSEAQEFFEGFDTDTYGLTSIITAPLELIGNIAGSTCSPLPLEIPFVGGTFNLPCMSTIYKKHFGSFLAIYQTITFGIVSYWVCVRIFSLVKDFKNPEHDEIEVMDL